MGKTSKTPKKKTKASPQPIAWTTSETRGFLLLSFAFLLLVSLISFAGNPETKNLMGFIGHSLGWILHAFFGLSSYFLVVYIAWIGWRMLFAKTFHHLWLKHLYVGIALCSFSLLLSLIETSSLTLTQSLGHFFYPGLWEKKMHYHLGGAPFFYLYKDLPGLNLYHLLNNVGAAIIFSSTFIASLIFLFKIRLTDVFQTFFKNLKEDLAEQRTQAPSTASPPIKTSPVQEKETTSDFMRFVKLRVPSMLPDSSQKSSSTPSDVLGIQPERNLTKRPSISGKEETEKWTPPPPPIEAPSKEKAREVAITSQKIYNGDFTHFSIPSPSLLTNAKKVDQSSLKKDLKKQAEVLEETLLSFGIEAKVGQINCGPTITSFEVHPAIGVKVQKIKTLDNDIALNMEAASIRIIAPIPGKAAVGIEVPNAHPQEVSFKEMLLAYQQKGTKFHIPVLLGKAVNGDYVMSDLAKMPHCIIAGATGSGKSVCINTLIMSILLNAKPDQVKLIMVDPKKVELTPYSRLPHMLAPVITEPAGAAAALNWLVKEMENRYDILKLLGVRNIDSFNQRTINPEVEAELGKEIPAQLPYIVGIIDELADLMMVASQDIETPIARIAQMARAVGIHLVLATQRPSREVITGLIKANFPTRISFKVASRVNSQIVLDEVGAESLLGNGDMLFLPPGSSHLIRAQGAFIRDEDIQAVIQSICNQSPPNYVIESFDRFHELQLNDSSKEIPSNLDSLFEEAKSVILGTGNASTTFLQRKLKIGYARAASLMDQLELQGVVGPAEGSKARKIFGRKEDASEEMDLQEV